MRPIFFKLQLFVEQDQDDLEASRLKLVALAQALCKVNEIHLLYFPNTPKLYESGVRYHDEGDVEIWPDIPTILETGWGDCEDLACYRVAELRAQGVKADPLIRWRKEKNRFVYHMLVLLPDNVSTRYSYKNDGGRWVEDPSKLLGMGTPEATMPIEQFERMIGKR